MEVNLTRYLLNLTRYLLLDDALSCLMMHCLWGVRRTKNEELIFLLTGPSDIKLFKVFKFPTLVLNAKNKH